MKNVEHFKVDLSIVEFINVDARIISKKLDMEWYYTVGKVCVPDIAVIYRKKYSTEELLRCRDELVEMIEKRMHLINKTVNFIIDSFDELKGINSNDFESLYTGFLNLEDKRKAAFFDDLETNYVTQQRNMLEGEWFLHEICRYNDERLYEEGGQLVDSWHYEFMITVIMDYYKWLCLHKKRIVCLFDLIVNKQVESKEIEKEVINSLIPELLQYKSRLLGFFFSLECAYLERRGLFLEKTTEHVLKRIISYSLGRASMKLQRYIQSGNINENGVFIDASEFKLIKENKLFTATSNYLQFIGWLLQCNLDRITDNESKHPFKYYGLVDFELEFGTIYIGKTNECGEVWLDYDEDIITLDYLKEYLRASLLVNLNLLGEYKQLDELCVF